MVAPTPRLSDTEERAVSFQSYGSNGEFDAERERLIAKLADTLDELIKIGGTPTFWPAESRDISDSH